MFGINDSSASYVSLAINNHKETNQTNFHKITNYE